MKKEKSYRSLKKRENKEELHNKAVQNYLLEQ